MLAAITQAAPQYRQEQYTTPIPILRQESVVNPDGSYQYRYLKVLKNISKKNKTTNKHLPFLQL